MTTSPIPLHIHRLITRATHAGYCLTRTPTPPHTWTLLDAEDGEPLFTSPHLDQIRQWLDT
ncbi:hypothetical protein [Nocardia blacklockiae]|uniref:hypothetical protein n=1 Tax=Nocardia blacklockiae TaxID=480036 RepID=UPI001894A27E|nr:hypothetical protein [Nocardia blacklockiae]MBF6173138.1 hypothetical protein [Nocardia blacklockiae]